MKSFKAIQRANSIRKKKSFKHHYDIRWLNSHDDNNNGSWNISTNCVDRFSKCVATSLTKAQTNRRRTSADENITYGGRMDWSRLNSFCYRPIRVKQGMSHFPNQCWPSTMTIYGICRCFGKRLVNNINVLSQHPIPLLPVLYVSSVIWRSLPMHTTTINSLCVVKLVCKVCLIYNKDDVSKQNITMFCNDVCELCFFIV